MFQPWSKKDSGQKIRKRKNEKIRSMTSTVELFHMTAIGKLRNIHVIFELISNFRTRDDTPERRVKSKKEKKDKKSKKKKAKRSHDSDSDSSGDRRRKMVS